MRIIGADESGNGDTFGGIAVACVSMTNKEIINVNPAIKDSKKLSDNQVKRLAKEIRSKYKYAEIMYEPEEYNEKWNKLEKIYLVLLDAYKKVLDKINIVNGDSLIIDQFTPSKGVRQELKAKCKNLTFKSGAESEIPVACASILARDLFVRSIERLNDEFKTTIPFGSVTGVVTNPLFRFVDKFSKANLYKVCKTHFRLVKTITASYSSPSKQYENADTRVHTNAQVKVNTPAKSNKIVNKNIKVYEYNKLLRDDLFESTKDASSNRKLSDDDKKQLIDNFLDAYLGKEKSSLKFVETNKRDLYLTNRPSLYSSGIRSSGYSRKRYISHLNKHKYNPHKLYR